MLQAEAAAATRAGRCVVSSKTEVRPGLLKHRMKECLEGDRAAEEYMGVGSHSSGIAALSWEPQKTFSGCHMIIFYFRKSPSGCRMENRKEGNQQRCRDISWESFTVQFGSVKGGAGGGNVEKK